MSESTATRLQTIMNQRNLRQADILRMAQPYCEKYNVKLGKSDLSQFVNGKVEPGQWKITILSLALSVSEEWLMGLDVPMERQSPSPLVLEKAWPRYHIKEKASDKGIKIVCRIDSQLYDSLCLLADSDDRSFEDELEFLLYCAVQSEIEVREATDKP